MMNMFQNTTGCRACGHDERREILAFGDMPLSNGLLSGAQLAQPEAKFPLTVLFCPNCSLVQIRQSHQAPEDLIDDCGHPKHASLHLRVTPISGCDGFEPAQMM